MTVKSEKKDRAKKQRRYRERLRREGFVRIETYISAETWKKLAPILAKYGGSHQPGYAFAKFLEKALADNNSNR